MTRVSRSQPSVLIAAVSSANRLAATGPLPFHPTYSSWLNQVEIWFGRVQRDVIARGVFSSIADLARKLRRYIQAYSAHSKPIKWKYSDPSRHIGNTLYATRH